MLDIGDIYDMKVYFDDNPNHYKIRPVLIVNVVNKNIYTIAEITKTEPCIPPKYYDQFKELIADWKEANLHYRSYVKAHKVYNVQKFKLHKFIGKVSPNDLTNIFEKILEKNRVMHRTHF